MENGGTSNSLTIHVHKPNLKEKMFFLLAGMLLSIPLTVLVEGSRKKLKRRDNGIGFCGGMKNLK